MSAPKRYTEREMVLAKREGFVRGIQSVSLASPRAAEYNAALAYPFPKIERPRVMADVLRTAMRVEWAVAAGHIVMRKDSGRWMTASEYQHDNWCAPLPERVAMWSYLLANPTELTDDTGEVE